MTCALQSECWKEENQPGGVGWSGEIYHSDSRCFFSNLSKEVWLLRGILNNQVQVYQKVGLQYYPGITNQRKGAPKLLQSSKVTFLEFPQAMGA